MEIIFLAGAAAIVGLYIFNSTLCYVVVGGGYAAILLSLITSRALRDRRLKVRLASVNPLETAVRVGPFHQPQKLGDIPRPQMMGGGGQ
jgi:hypothetical protein